MACHQGMGRSGVHELGGGCAPMQCQWKVGLGASRCALLPCCYPPLLPAPAARPRAHQVLGPVVEQPAVAVLAALAKGKHGDQRRARLQRHPAGEGAQARAAAGAGWGARGWAQGLLNKTPGTAGKSRNLRLPGTRQLALPLPSYAHLTKPVRLRRYATSRPCSMYSTCAQVPPPGRSSSMWTQARAQPPWGPPFHARLAPQELARNAADSASMLPRPAALLPGCGWACPEHRASPALQLPPQAGSPP